MSKCYEIDGVKPVIPTSTFVHPDAVIIGDVVIGENCYIGPLCSLRGDFGRIRIGSGSNIQDSCVLHSFPDRDCTVEENGHISHGAILHGCHIKSFGFVGINSVVMDDAIIGEHAMVAAMAFVKAKFEVPDRCLAAGMPAKIIREMGDDEVKWTANGPIVYQQLARRSLDTLKPTEPLREVDANRPNLNTGAEPSKPLHETRK